MAETRPVPLYRTFSTELEYRERAGKRLLSGPMLPFDSPTDVDVDLREEFSPHAFDHMLTAAHRVALRSDHSNVPASFVLGTGVELEPRGGSLWGTFKVGDSPMGDHYLSMAREGLLRQWSVGFFSDRSRRVRGGTVRHERASIFETALVPSGAYGELAAVAEVRQRQPRPVGTPNLDRWRSRFA